MNVASQTLLLAAYRGLLRTRILNTAAGYAAFERGYDLYKAWFEAVSLKHVRPFVPEGSTVVDVGAHVGFFTQRFAQWVGEKGRVLSLEPEPINYGRLLNRVARTGLAARVTALNVAAVEAPGQYFLHVDPTHPGDHQLAAAGLAVPGRTVDDVVESCGGPDVSLLKLDVQGAEARVLSGATATLKRFRPALMIEVDDLRLRRQGSNPAALLEHLAENGYAPRLLSRSGISRALATPAAVDLAREEGGYSDFLFVGREPAD